MLCSTVAASRCPITTRPIHPCRASPAASTQTPAPKATRTRTPFPSGCSPVREAKRSSMSGERVTESTEEIPARTRTMVPRATSVADQAKRVWARLVVERMRWLGMRPNHPTSSTARWQCTVMSTKTTYVTWANTAAKDPGRDDRCGISQANPHMLNVVPCRSSDTGASRRIVAAGRCTPTKISAAAATSAPLFARDRPAA
mmetsp:Transcript_45263/g.119457  ORF Transcript_45263/g.119457 Transcript_45263/m.119457 type:complete len:201 (+) Transcript_45263:434-1036(+)